MRNRWGQFQRELQQLDARILLINSQYFTATPSKDVEILTDQQSPHTNPYFTGVKYVKDDDTRISGSLRSSMSGSPATSPQSHDTFATLSPDLPSSLRRQSSTSDRSHSTARTEDRPPWKLSFRSEASAQQTPTSGQIDSASIRQSRVIPTTPTLKIPSISSSRTSGSGLLSSRIPVINPKVKPALSRGSSAHGSIPALAVSTSHSYAFLSRQPKSGGGQVHLDHARQAMKTPDSQRPRSSAARSAFQPRSTASPILGNRSLSSGSVPHTAPRSRPSIGRACPSSFRPVSPSPVNRTSRPASRTSVKSYSNVNTAHLQPFQPSKYDLLDQHVQSIIEETGFTLFVGRVDPPLRRGQRKSDEEEWKGDFVFGAGEKPMRVKLVKLAGRYVHGILEPSRTKCLARLGGTWQELSALLKQRAAETSP